MNGLTQGEVHKLALLRQAMRTGLKEKDLNLVVQTQHEAIRWMKANKQRVGIRRIAIRSINGMNNDWRQQWTAK